MSIKYYLFICISLFYFYYMHICNNNDSLIISFEQRTDTKKDAKILEKPILVYQ